uniref:Conserved oligomeric Golgi complex subunit 3 n=1 Tax=Lygus hesperus TaxID=30085 RepID=A0A0A9XES7_LYGHE
MDDDPFGIQSMRVYLEHVNEPVSATKDDVPRVITAMDILAKVRSQYAAQYRPLPPKIRVMEMQSPWEQLQPPSSSATVQEQLQQRHHSDSDTNDLYAMNTFLLSPTVSLETVIK